MSNIAPSDSPSLPSVSRHQFLIEHVRIDSEKPYLESRTALEELPRFDERIRSHLLHGDIERAKAELNDIQGDAGLVIFSIATHGDWLQILLGKRNVVQYVIGNVLVSTQMTQHELAAGLMHRSGSCFTRTGLAHRRSNMTDRHHSSANTATKM